MSNSPVLLSSKENKSYGTTDIPAPDPGSGIMKYECDNLGFDGERSEVEKNKSPRKTKYDEGKYFEISVHLLFTYCWW